MRALESNPVPRQSSFRDPEGQVLHIDGRILRAASASGQAELSALFSSATWREWADDGRFPRTWDLPRTLWPESLDVAQLASAPAMVVEHEPLPFPSYPYEWPPEMLHAAGSLTLALAESLQPEGMGIKDATPYNVLFRGPNAVYVDLLSCERRDERDPIWLPYAQFIRTFLLPLLLIRVGVSDLAGLFLVRRDGIEPEEIYRYLSTGWRLRATPLALCTLPVWLSRLRSRPKPDFYRPRRTSEPALAQFTLRSTWRGLRRHLHRLEPRPRDSGWTDYTQAHPYRDEDLERKKRLVHETLRRLRPSTVLDVGSNTGDFALIAAGEGAEVVAIDRDPAAVGAVWRRAINQRLPVLPLVVDFTRPSPAMGWKNQECTSFVERTRKRFDLVLFLAVFHHVLITERVPLNEVLGLLAESSRQFVLMEYVDPADPMFQDLLRGRDHLFRGLTVDSFEAACRQAFRLIESTPVNSTRRLYLLETH